MPSTLHTNMLASLLLPNLFDASYETYPLRYKDTTTRHLSATITDIWFGCMAIELTQFKVAHGTADFEKKPKNVSRQLTYDSDAICTLSQDLIFDLRHHPNITIHRNHPKQNQRNLRHLRYSQHIPAPKKNHPATRNRPASRQKNSGVQSAAPAPTHHQHYRSQDIQ